MKDQGYEHAHSSPIKTPQQLAVVVVLAFVIPVIGLILLAQVVIAKYRVATTTADPEAIARRIQPVARVEFGDAAPSGPRVAKTGEEVYKAVCSVCHGTGAAGAWKFGDKAAWAPHLKEGLDALAKNAINGIRAMPPRGGNPDLSDLEVTRAVVYMANAAGATFKEPAAPAIAAAKPAPARERTGEQIVQAGCGNCHLTGEGGAPKVGDRAAWSKRISAGIDKVTASAIRGHGGMPARGGFADLTDPEVRSAILYMFDSAGGKVVAAAAAPPTPAAAPATPDATALLQKSGCLACHQVDKRVVGPSYKEVAAKYAGDKNALALLEKKVKAGSVGTWGQVPMPPHPQLSDADLQAMVTYILAQK
jgi:cytochrome c5